MLTIEVVEGRDLIPMDKDGTSDPYCTISLGSKKKKTKCIKNTLNPNWRVGTKEEYVFNVRKLLAKGHNIVTVKCFDWDKYSSDDRMGLFTIDITTLRVGKTERWFPLLPQKSGDPVSGEIRVIFLYQDDSVQQPKVEPQDPIWDAVKRIDLEAFQDAMKSATLNLTEVNHANMSILHYVVSKKSIPHELEDDNIAIILEILDHPDIDVNQRSDGGNTAFHYFCKIFPIPNCASVFEKFIQRGADVNAVNDNGETPLHQAMFNQALKVLIIHFLLENGADVNAQNESGNTALHYAVRLGREDLMIDLIVAGADVHIEDNHGNTAYLIAKQQYPDYPILAEILQEGVKVKKWLISFGMGEYVQIFLEQQIYLFILPDISDNELEAFVPNQADRELILSKAGDIPDFNRTQSIKKKKKLFARKKRAAQREEQLRCELRDSVTSGNESWEINPRFLEFNKILGAGASGQVFKGVYSGQIVAIKVLKSMKSKKMKDEFRREFEILVNTRSPYIVDFFGAAVSQKVCMVMEFCSRGSLYDVLQDENLDLGWEDFFKMFGDTTKGLHALHTSEPPIIHRDLKSLNVLVTKDFTCKIADFGLSRLDTTANLATLGRCRGTYAYIPPESYHGVKCTESHDRYSLGVILWEFTARVVKGEYLIPYKEYDFITMDFHILYNVAEDKLRPTIPNIPDDLKSFLQQIWHQEPTERPDTHTILEALESLENDYHANPDVWNGYLESR
eukprot:TRINITY_DN6606_c0_g1_i1.p1 TRINITY_DN6606_c0_g1~~TRINITY_DN6606_c0_g1_i1.p1  ORF type:complete len:734 (-),score=170.18 TRINITY_DN6606_c0_g1_i1:45-2246(-)